MASAQLELSAEDVELLGEVLDATIRDLSPEIADTDNPAYRRGLVERRQRLQDLRSRLNAPA
jgi:hypothetical protein